jgi:hypothetical protein
VLAGQIGRSEAETRRRTSNDFASSDHGFLGAVPERVERTG